MNPAISVVLPVFNAVAYVEAAVQSVLEQTFENFELILIDDGSTDASGDILRKLAARDTRVRLIQRENRGLIATLNEGVAMARAPFVARMDADDISLPCRLALQFERMCADPSLVVLGGAIRYLDAAGRLGRTVVYPTGEKIETAILWGAPVAHPATMFRTEAGRRVGGYSHLFAHAEDYALWLQLRNSGKVDNLPQTVLHYRVHGQSTSHMHALSQRTSTLRAQALWLAGVQPSPALIDIPSNLDFLESLPLLQQTRVDILARHCRPILLAMNLSILKHPSGYKLCLVQLKRPHCARGGHGFTCAQPACTPRWPCADCGTCAKPYWQALGHVWHFFASALTASILSLEDTII